MRPRQHRKTCPVSLRFYGLGRYNSQPPSLHVDEEPPRNIYKQMPIYTHMHIYIYIYIYNMHMYRSVSVYSYGYDIAGRLMSLLTAPKIGVPLLYSKYNRIPLKGPPQGHLFAGTTTWVCRAHYGERLQDGCVASHHSARARTCLWLQRAIVGLGGLGFRP